MEAKVTLDQTAMESLVQKAIFDSMTEEKRNELLVEAIRHLTTVPQNGYSKVSPLTEAFRRAAERIAVDTATAKMENNPAFKQNVEQLFVDVSRKLFEGEIRESLVKKICESVVCGLNARDY